MKKDKENSTYDFDNDAEFNENFYKNIEKALGDTDIPVYNTIGNSVDSTTEDAGKPEEIQMNEDTETTAGDNESDENGNVSEIMYEESAAASSAAEELPDNEIDDKLADISNLLAEQISAELDTIKTQGTEVKKHHYFRLQSGIVMSILCLLGFGFFFGFTKPGNHMLMDMGINIGGIIWASGTNDFTDTTVVTQDIDYVDEEDVNTVAQEVDTSTIIWPNKSGQGRQEAGVYNILLLGEEAIGQGAGRGRTDEIVIATLNTNNKTVKLTSLMRDILVQIPDFKENKLNAAYEEGGIDLLYKTIANNFDIHIDGSVLVNFKNFEKIVDDLGGLNITLTSTEANYLNSTNYISDPANRNVVEGIQLMNGNQVLGYSRVRKRAAITGNNNDYGRTDRHRIVLDAIFDKCKSLGKADLLTLMLKYLPMITTDIGSDSFQALLEAYLKTGAKEVQQLRIPADGTFDDNAKVRGMSVLILDFDKNINILHSFIFGDNTVDNAVDNTGTTTDTNANSSEVIGTTDSTGN